MVLNFGNADSGFGVGVQDFIDEVFAFGGEELGHLVVCTHDLLVKI